MIQHNISSDIYDNKFARDCRIITAVRKNENNNIVLKGPGEISQNGNGIFKLKLYCTYVDDYLKQIKSEKDIIFSALDTKGDKWNFELNHLKTNEFIDDETGIGFIITGTFNRLELVSNKKKYFTVTKNKKNYACISLKNFEGFPFTEKSKKEIKHQSSLITNEYSSIVNYKDKFISVQVSKINEMIQIMVFFHGNITNKNIEWLSLEGLQFIFGKRINPIMIQFFYKTILTTIFIAGNHDYSSSVESPIYLKKYPWREDKSLWKLYSRYLQFVINHKGDRFSTLGAIVNSVVGSGKSFFETTILILCVAVEGLVKELYSTNNKPITFLKELSKSNKISDDEVSTWYKLRNDSAHATLKITQENSEYYHISHMKVVELYYKLIFNKIKYNGIYTNYSNGVYGTEIYKA